MVHKIYLAKKLLWISLILLLLALVACGGSSDEAVEDTSEADTGAVDDSTESEAIADDGPSATGSEEDSGAPPATPDTGGKIESSRSTPNPITSSSDEAGANQPARIDSAETIVPQVDLVLLIDVTGSMADELASLQVGLAELTVNLHSFPEDGTLRLGMVTYSDQGKSNSVQMFSFTEDVELFSERLLSLTAVGGGDYAEELTDGFYQAVTGMTWRSAATKLLILFGDAPSKPAVDNSITIEEISALATEQNIAVLTIGSDDLDAAGTALYEQIAQNSNGRFFFITENPQNVANGATAVYTTAQLPALLMNIIEEVLDGTSP